MDRPKTSDFFLDVSEYEISNPNKVEELRRLCAEKTPNLFDEILGLIRRWGGDETPSTAPTVAKRVRKSWDSLWIELGKLDRDARGSLAMFFKRERVGKANLAQFEAFGEELLDFLDNYDRTAKKQGPKERSKLTCFARSLFHLLMDNGLMEKNFENSKWENSFASHALNIAAAIAGFAPANPVRVMGDVQELDIELREIDRQMAEELYLSNSEKKPEIEKS